MLGLLFIDRTQFGVAGSAALLVSVLGCGVLDGLSAASSAAATPLAASTTSLNEVTSTTPPVTNQGVTLVATVTSTLDIVAPSGTIAFDNGGVPIGGCGSVPTPTQTSSSVTVTCGTSFGASSSPARLSAVFTPSQDSLLTGSSSQEDPLLIDQGSTLTMVLASDDRAKVGGAVTFTALVIPSEQGSLMPSGTVSFAQDGRTIGQCSAQPLGPSSTASCTVKYASVSSHTVSVVYAGDGSFAPSTSGPATVAVQSLGTISATMQWTFFYSPTYSQVRALIVSGAPPGATVLLKCRGGGCPFTAKAITAGRAEPCGATPGRNCGGHSAIDLTHWLNRKRLAVGTRITAEIVESGWIGKDYVFTFHSRRAPTVQIGCLEPGQTSPGVGC